MLQVVEWIVGLVSGLLASQMGMNTTWFWAFSALSLSALLGASSALFYNVGAPGYWGPPTPSVGTTKVTRGFPSLPAMIGIGRQLLTSIGFALMAIGTFETLGIYLPPFVHAIIALIGGIVLFDAIANRGTSSFPMIGIRAPALAAMSAACLYTIFFAYASHSTITAAKMILFGTLFLSANDVIPHVWGPDAFDGYGAAAGKLMLIPGLYAVSHGVHYAQPYLSKWIPGT